MICVGIGQDSHRFEEENAQKKCILGGIEFKDVPGMSADSDGDVILHAACNAISSITGIPILGDIAIKMCKAGEKDSSIYLQKALQTLNEKKIKHIAFTIEGKRPRMQSRIDEMRKKIALLMNLYIDQVGITCTSGDELTDFGRGFGIQCFCIVTVMAP